MDVHVAVVGLPENLHLRVKIALKLQAGHGHRVEVQDRLGVRADVVIFDRSSQESDAILHRCSETGIPALMFVDRLEPVAASIRAIDRRQSLNDLQSVIRSLLEQAQIQRGGQSGHANESTCALLRLAEDPLLDHPDLSLQFGDNKVIVRRSAARVIGRRFSDIVNASEHLTRGGWTIQPVQPSQGQLGEWVSRSLDGFLIRGSRKPAANLPRFAPGPWRLRDWPDLGEADDPIAMRVAGLLSSQAWTADALSERCEVPTDRVHALLWAFKAGRVLDTSEADFTEAKQRSTPRTDDSRPSLLARLARRFGLHGGPAL